MSRPFPSVSHLVPSFSLLLPVLLTLTLLLPTGCRDKSSAAPGNTSHAPAQPSGSTALPNVDIDTDDELTIDQAIANLDNHGWHAQIRPEKTKKKDREVAMYISKVVVVLARYDDSSESKKQYQKMNGNKGIIAARYGHLLVSVKCDERAAPDTCMQALRDVATPN